MPKKDPLEPADFLTAEDNIRRIASEGPGGALGKFDRARMITGALRQELKEKGLKGFKRGGKVRKTGPAKVHKGEFVVKPSGVKKLGAAKLRAANRPVRRTRR